MSALNLAALLLALAGIAHSYLGERYILIRLFRRADLPKLFGGTQFTTQILRLAWHVTSLAWWGFAALLAMLARAAPTREGICWVAGITFLLTAVAILIFTRGRHLAWMVFLIVGAICSSAALDWL
jgi:hypothetical protein